MPLLFRPAFSLQRIFINTGNCLRIDTDWVFWAWNGHFKLLSKTVMAEWVPWFSDWKRRIGLNLKWKVRDCSSHAIYRKTIKCVTCSDKMCQLATATSLKNHLLMWVLCGIWCPSRAYASADRTWRNVLWQKYNFFYVHANICPAEDLINDMMERFCKDFGRFSHQHQADDIFSIFSEHHRVVWNVLLGILSQPWSCAPLKGAQWEPWQRKQSFWISELQLLVFSQLFFGYYQVFLRDAVMQAMFSGGDWIQFEDHRLLLSFSSILSLEKVCLRPAEPVWNNSKADQEGTVRNGSEIVSFFFHQWSSCSYRTVMPHFNVKSFNFYRKTYPPRLLRLLELILQLLCTSSSSSQWITRNHRVYRNS